MEAMANLLEKAEGLIYVIAGVLLAVAALVIFGHAVVVFVEHIGAGEVTRGVIDLLEELLLALMAVELLYTVTVSLRTHSLSAEPFLVVGLVAAVRRILTLSVEAANLLQTDIEHFKMALYEIGLLTVAILVLVYSIYVLRRCRRWEQCPEEAPGR
jgi:uncharacterized membrane protein (DUF373 family)